MVILLKSVRVSANFGLFNRFQILSENDNRCDETNNQIDIMRVDAISEKSSI
jgi:hypothetical protein